jgi:hypothetical protein
MRVHPANGTFSCLSKTDLTPIEEILRSEILAMMKHEGKIGHGLIKQLMNGHHIDRSSLGSMLLGASCAFRIQGWN